MSNKIKFVIFVIVAFFSGISIGFLIKSDSANIPSHVNEQIRLKGYELINPLLECEYNNDKTNVELFNFFEDLKKYVQKLDDNKVTKVSIYFRDLNNGVWFGINENEDFSPASLLKVPLMISYLKKAEEDKSILFKKIKYSGRDDDQKQNIKPNNSIEREKEYSVDELIRYMIVYSDNNAKTVLLNSINEFEVNKTYMDLGIDIPGIRGLEDYMSVKSYASFFRILYNASYLNKEMSQKALKLLSESDYKDGLVAGVPKGIVVAQKFGERKMGSVDQLHDCGIVYHPQKPYLLCVMTRGTDFNYQGRVIADVSKFVYSSIEKQINN